MPQGWQQHCAWPRLAARGGQIAAVPSELEEAGEEEEEELSDGSSAPYDLDAGPVFTPDAPGHRAGTPAARLRPGVVPSPRPHRL